MEHTSPANECWPEGWAVNKTKKTGKNMKRLNCIELVLALASLTVATGKMGAAPVGTTFTYQGRLADGGGPVGQQGAKTAG